VRTAAAIEQYEEFPHFDNGIARYADEKLDSSTGIYHPLPKFMRL
jgi:hypothetical protein